MSALTQQTAKHFREVFFGGNWTWSNFQDNLKDVTWQEATSKVADFNTIAVLTFHSGYFVTALLDVLEGKPLTAHDKFSFDHPPILSQEDWEQMLQKMWSEVERAAVLIEQLTDEKLLETFVEAKYGNYYRNILGTIEHAHYHLGQIALVKKLLRAGHN